MGMKKMELPRCRYMLVGNTQADTASRLSCCCSYHSWFDPQALGSNRTQARFCCQKLPLLVRRSSLFLKSKPALLSGSFFHYSKYLPASPTNGGNGIVARRDDLRSSDLMME